MKRVFDIEHWSRKEHFELFRHYDEPFWGLVAEVECSHAYTKAKRLGVSFFVYYLYQSLRAVNVLEYFRLRIEGEQVVCYDKIHASATIGRADESFAFSFIEFADKLETFNIAAKKEMDLVKNSVGIRLEGNNRLNNVIHYSAIPWIHFTGLSHARNFDGKDSVPKISFGKLAEKGNGLFMPVSLHAHHALMDGYHAGKFFELFQRYLDE